ncbi:SusC/RagA family TonB-linked outer membrane protein [Niastella populi]|uniref:TonB-dependent receptor plug domain-containing protein n=1 Tax=Niastella populi TaxID=550983 RepID=A0A1V9GAS6_9BACT|nr:SusC/RagA family TonB-linked outer membrane protein [Niastella populi]OQP67680.1 hypothetical protein A4R26_11495 [Niastella populi]
MNIALMLTLTLFVLSFKSPNQTIHDRVTINVTNADFEQVLEEIKRQTGYSFNYDRAILQIVGKVTLHEKNVKVKTVLEKCFRNKPLTCEFDPTVITITKIESRNNSKRKPQVKIPFKAVNEDGETLQEYEVKVWNNSKIVYSQVRGNDLYLPDSNARIIVSAPGYHTVDTIVNIVPQIPLLTLSLKPDHRALDVIIKLGYGKTTRRLNTSNVTKISAKEFQTPIWNGFPSLLSGRVPGLLVTQTNGLPSSFIKTQVQGQSSIGTKRGRLPLNDPLYVIDGVPFAANNNSLQVLSSGSALGSYGRSPLVNVDVNDIESVEVLKDADGTAIYGSRGAKGVVLITSKQGKPGSLSISADIQTGIGTLTRRPKMLNTEQYIQMRQEALRNDNQSLSSTDKDLLLLDASQYIDFNKVLLGSSAKSQYAGISISSGSKNIHYYLSGNYHQQTTVFPGNLGEDRGNLHFRITYKSPNRRLTTTWSGSYCNDATSLILTDLTTTLILPPHSPQLFDGTGKLNWGHPSFPYSNPLALLYQPYCARTENSLASLFLNYRISSNLTIKATIGYNKIGSSETSIIPIKSLNPYNAGDTGTAFFGESAYKSFIAEPQLEYYQYLGKGKLTVLIGSSFQKIINNNSRYTASGYTNDDDYRNPTAAANINYAPPLQNKYSYRAMFGRVSYIWSDKYIANFTSRIEASDRQEWTTRIGQFGAIGIGWIFTNEPFLIEKSQYLSFGKIRASVGTTGGDPIGDYQYFDGLSRNSSNTSNNDHSKLEWEKTWKLNCGLELGLFQDRMYFSVDYFRNRSSNQLITMPSRNGSNSSIVTNWPAIVQNSGFEFVLQFKSDDKKKFGWSTNVALTIPRNKLISFPELQDSPYKLLFKEGESLTMQQGYHSLGVNPNNGIFSFEDKNGDQKLNFSDDYSMSGNLDPKAYGGLSLNLSYKNWHLGSLLEGRIQQGYSYIYKIYKIAPPGTAMANQPTQVLNRWQKPGDKSVFQLYTTGSNSLAYDAYQNMQQSDARFADASFIRVKNITLSFDFPPKWLLKPHLKSASLYFQATNSAVITKYKLMDPETQELNSLPPLKTYVLGVHLSL